MENEIVDLPVIVSQDGDDEMHAEIDSRAARMFARDLEGRFDDYAGYAEATFDAITKALKKGGEVRLVGFGTFAVAKRKASTGRNPRTGEEMKIPASNQPKFKAGKALKDAVN